MYSHMNLLVWILGLFLATSQFYYMILVSASNPGIWFTSFGPLYCPKCQLNVIETVRHCSQCNVCVEEIDHHCPWTSKCIAKNNLLSFYRFIFFTLVVTTFYSYNLAKIYNK